MTQPAPSPPPRGFSRSAGAAQESQLPGAAGIRRHHRCAGSDGCVLLPQGGGRGSALPLRDASGRAGVRWGADVVAAATARAERIDRGARHPLPAGNGRSLARGRIQVIRAGSSDRAPGHHHRGLRHAQPRGCTRARGPADRHRQRPRRAGGAPDQARCPRSGEHGDRGRGEFRGHQHAVGVAHRRSVSDDGSVRARRPLAGSRAGPGSARRGRRLAHLRRAGRLDRFRDVFARRAQHSARRRARRRRVPLGARNRCRRRLTGHCDPQSWPCCSGPSSNAGCCSSHRSSALQSEGWRSPSPRDRTGAPRKCSSPARTRFRRSSRTPRAGQSGHSCCSSCARALPTAPA